MSALGQRDFRIVFTAYGLSSIGDYLALTALTLRVRDLTDSGWAVAALLLSGLVPLVVFATVAGSLVDRLETVKVLSITGGLQAAVAVGLAFADTMPLILALSFLLGTGVAVTQPGLLVLVPRTVGEAGVTRANSYLEVARWAGAPAGALAGGALTAAIGSRYALLLDAATFLLVAAAILGLRVRHPPVAAGAEEDQPRHRSLEGFAFLARDRLLRLVVLVLGSMVVFASIDNVAEPFFAKDVLAAKDAGYGAMVAAWTLGIGIGAILTGRAVGPRRLAPAVLLAAILGGGAVAVAAGFPHLGITLAMFLVGGVANGVELVSMRSLITHRVPERLRGRAFAAYYGLVNGAQIAAMGAGALMFAWLGARGTLAFAGTGAAAVGLAGLLLYLRLPGNVRAVAGADAPAGLPDPGVEEHIDVGERAR